MSNEKCNTMQLLFPCKSKRIPRYFCKFFCYLHIYFTRYDHVIDNIITVIHLSNKLYETQQKLLSLLIYISISEYLF